MVTTTPDDDAANDEIELRPLVNEEKQKRFHIDSLVPPSPFAPGGLAAHKHDDDADVDEEKTPSTGKASQKQVAVNIFISFVGAGMLGMPYAFSRSGWLLGSVALAMVSAANVYAMILLVKTRKMLEQKGHSNIQGYGDVGRIVLGTAGGRFVDLCLVISQVGFATAYIIFIAANIHNISHEKVERVYVCFGCVPVLAVLVQARDMKTLSPFSLVADVANFIGLGAVLLQDFESFNHGENIEAVRLSNLLYVTGVSIYSLEGVGLILPLESSCADRDAFPSLLKKVIFGITLLMTIFGCFGYAAFGSQTEAPITLNLQGDWATFVKLALCLALYLTYPVMLFPVNDVMEDLVLNDQSKPSRVFRLCVVLSTAFIAYTVPDFGKFLSLVGSSICTILGFIIPCYFHLKVFSVGVLRYWEICLDVFLITFGIVFGALGTYESFKNLLT